MKVAAIDRVSTDKQVKRDGVAAGLHDPDPLDAGLTEPVGGPAGRPPDFATGLRVGGDARDAEQVQELSHKAVAVLKQTGSSSPPSPNRKVSSPTPEQGCVCTARDKDVYQGVCLPLSGQGNSIREEPVDVPNLHTGPELPNHFTELA